MSLPTQPELKQEADVWIVRVLKENGRLQEYRCASEAQARALLAVLGTTEPTPDQPRH